MLMRLHSGALSKTIDARIAALFRSELAKYRDGRSPGLSALFDGLIAEAVDGFYRGDKPNPERLIGSRLLVIKSWSPGERGVLVVDYSNIFPLVPGLFDLEAIAERYRIVLEPSWAGVCTPDILLYSRLGAPVYIETVEPRDREFLETIGTNLAPVPLAANWWVDHRVSPSVSAERDIDVIMVAAWGGIKRHWRFLKALGRLRRRGHRVRTMLIGYPQELTMADIRALAERFGVSDQVETREWLTREEVGAMLARAKVFVLWSRRECANRAIIEAMEADVPVIVRKGLTFGYAYPYINERTGRFVAEDDLGDGILEMLEHRNGLAPRDWILSNMTPERGTRILEDHLRGEAARAGEPWTSGLAVKTSNLVTQIYWHEGDRAKFDADYDFLRKCVRSS
jgi:glycosyltransferase involved in cell wall biosynthesis